MEQTDAIVLRVYPWSETSLIANLYTRESGKISAVAKGARRPKSPFEAALDLLSICRVVFIPKSADALDILTEAKLLRRFRAGSRDLLRLNCGYYLAELLDRLTDKGDKQVEIFELALATLQALEQPACDPRAIVLRLELQLLRMVGHAPSWDACVQCGKLVADVNWVFYNALLGGVVCDQCRVGSREQLRISASARRYLASFSHGDWQEIEVDRFESEHAAVARALLGRTLTTLLDRKLQLHDYIEELGR